MIIRRKPCGSGLAHHAFKELYTLRCLHEFGDFIIMLFINVFIYPLIDAINSLIRTLTKFFILSIKVSLRFSVYVFD